MKKLLIIIIILAIAGIGTWQLTAHSKANGGSQYTTVKIERGDIQTLISCTGTLQAVETVDVGTQVSGIIEKIYVDFNDKVKKGQLIAVLDTDLLEIAMRDAEASVAKAQAELNEAQRDLERNQSLLAKNLLPQKDYDASLTSVEMAQASLMSANAALERAKINLDFAEIRSPIDGIVIERSVDEGQTVAASLSAPTLFVIAKDLNNMQILAQADESDIGQIRQEQSVKFTVPAFPDITFEGRVQQIRLQPETVSNVVMYTVVVDAQNKDGMLLPGMTATVDFIVQDVQDVLCVSNAALRFHPSEDMTAKRRNNRKTGGRDFPRPPQGDRPPPPQLSDDVMVGGMKPTTTAEPPEDVSMLWFVDDEGNLDMSPVRTGATNGTLTEIVEGRKVTEGMQVISGVQNAKSKSSAVSSDSRQRGGPPGPRLF